VPYYVRRTLGIFAFNLTVLGALFLAYALLQLFAAE
jgi:hypothetical protein